jgi:hypothetical protein
VGEKPRQCGGLHMTFSPAGTAAGFTANLAFMTIWTLSFTARFPLHFKSLRLFLKSDYFKAVFHIKGIQKYMNKTHEFTIKGEQNNFFHCENLKLEL